MLTKLKELGGNIQWHHTGGHSATRPEDVCICPTLKDPMLDNMGRNDTHDSGITVFSLFSNLQVLRLIVAACKAASIRHLLSYQLHVRSSPRMLLEFRKAINEVDQFLNGNMGYLLVLVISCMDPNEMIGVDALLKDCPSRNGPATAGEFLICSLGPSSASSFTCSVTLHLTLIS
ncbi:hypothetical protein EHS25_007194 [Saitozyma podzolica]|uniref:Uncharacterized protein n=1 Tax=Saitozyma podzolica TaxID=1890683 RepID=A0A427XN62_9TREE|nr:hypothetical protein EHS25_007194 [Saitozyma podzolica]